MRPESSVDLYWRHQTVHEGINYLLSLGFGDKQHQSGEGAA